MDNAIQTLNHDEHYRFHEFNRVAHAFHETTNRLKALQKEHTNTIQTLAHDIKTPLTIINGLMDGLRQNRIAFSQKTYDSLIEETTRINTLIEKIIIGNEEKTHTSLNLSKLTRSVIETHKVLFERKGVILQYNLDSEVYIKGYDEDIKRVLDHLLQNSLRYTNTSKSVMVQLNKKEKTLMIKDEGKGFNNTDQSSTDESLNVVSKTGIGLHIVKQILDAHDANFTIKSTENEGTTITIHFHS